MRWGAFGRAAQFFLPANRTLLRRQRGVLVHGQWAASVLREEDPELAVRVVLDGHPTAGAADVAASAAPFASVAHTARGASLLGSFGFQTPIKRTDVAIRALARAGLESVHLLIAGELSPYSNYGALAAELGVAERVHVTGFLPFEQLDAAISAIDLCLNLRYPTAGETSASLLRILAVGRPVVVSDYADFGDLPEDLAVHIPPGEGEMQKLAAALAQLLDDRSRLARMGEAARRYVADVHAPEPRRTSWWPPPRSSRSSRPSPTRAAAGSANHGGAKERAGPDRRPRLRGLVARRASPARGRGRQRQPDPLVAEPGAAGRGHLRGAVPLRGA